MVLVFLAVTYVVVLNALRPHTPGRELSLDRVERLAKKGQVSELTFLAQDFRIVGSTGRGPFWTGLAGETQTSALASDLAARGVPTRIDTQSSKDILRLATQIGLPAATLVVGFLFMLVLLRGYSSGELALFGRSSARRYSSEAERPVTFADVAGLDEAIEELREARDFLSAPERFEEIGATPPKGILLLGPPGCGKTLLARAVAGEAGVPFFSISATEFVEMLVGVGASRVRDLFEQARAAAPAIVFIDEIDAIGRERSTGGGLNVEWEASLNELLVQLDGFDPSSRVMLMAATNRADMLDSALVRKGRFDRHVVIDLPDVAGRSAIFKVHAQGKKLAPDLRLDDVARRTVGLSGADIASVMNEAALLAARRRLQAIGQSELTEAVDRVVAGPERRSHTLGEEEKLRVAYHESGHALVGWVLNVASTVDKVSIVARGRALASTWHLPTEDRQLTTRTQLEEEIAFLLAGRAAEDVVYSDIANGSQDDIERATTMARQMVCELGMSDSVGPRVVRGPRAGDGRAGEDGSGPGIGVAEEAEREIGRLLGEADARGRAVLSAYRAELDRLATLLVERETLERHDLERLLGGLSKGMPAEGAERGVAGPAAS